MTGMFRPGMFRRYIARARTQGALVLQPRMGWGDPLQMREALLAVKTSGAGCIGTLTLDSYTRTGDYQTPLACLRSGQQLNGYPLVSHPVATSAAVLEGVFDEEFPVQVRHGTPQPLAIFRRMIEVGLDATEGGPVSYCLPYGRVSLAAAIHAWQEACCVLADEVEQPHVESFGGCLMGQLCPPSMLVAMSLLECLFFKACGITSVSLSYAQAGCYAQDRAALRLLREFAQVLLSAEVDWHVVLYTYMGLFPTTHTGAARLIADSACLAKQSGSERLIFKTTAESRQLPTLAHNLQAIRIARAAADAECDVPAPSAHEQACYEEMKSEVSALLEAVLGADPQLGRALSIAFQRGWLDVPYCLHADNRGQARSAIDQDGRLVWVDTGNLPIKTRPHRQASAARPSQALLQQLTHVARRYDSMAERIDRVAHT